MHQFPTTIDSCRSYQEIIDEKAGKNDYMPRAIHSTALPRQKPPLSQDHQVQMLTKYTDMPL